MFGFVVSMRLLDLVCLWHIERKIRSVSCLCLKSQVAKGAPDRYYSNEHTRSYCCCFRPVDKQRGTGCCHSDLPLGVCVCVLLSRLTEGCV